LINKWLREPLLHFLLLGAAIFAVYGYLTPEAEDNSHKIVISAADIDRIAALWQRKWQRPPTGKELDGLIEAQVREEVLYREALAMGLDENDTIVRRRLAQKIEFISADLASQAEPDDAELQEYLGTHADKFAIPGLISFDQVYLNTDRRGSRAGEDAKRLLEELERGDSVDIMALGDPFMFGAEHDQLTLQGVARLFGQSFAETLFTLPVGDWQGPVPSGYGLHIVRIDSRTPTRYPELDEVRDRVRDEWLADQRRRMDKAFYNGLRKRYEVIIERPGADKAGGPGNAEKQ
jgi:hypothetical protein